MTDLTGKIALVTGAGGEHGIGRAIAVRLAADGADVVVNDLVKVPYSGASDVWKGLAAVVEEIATLGQKSLAIEADVSDAAQVQNMVDEVIDKFGHIDILVNNAGSRPGKDRVPVVDLEEEVWDHLQRDLDHPTLSPVADLLRAALPAPTSAIRERLRAHCAS